MTLFDAFKDAHLRPGIYRLDTGIPEAAIAESTLGRGLRFAVADAGHADAKHEVLKVFARALPFPDYFGSNWDALEECLCELTWDGEPPRGIVLVIKGIGNFATNEPAEFATLIAVLNAVTDAWWEDGRLFYTLLLDEGSLPGADPWVPLIQRPFGMQAVV